jgi:putative nucleotidyltransferase with HDIG domain
MVVRAAVVLVPLAASIGVGLLVATALPSPSTATWTIVWWACVLVVSTLVLRVVDRAARRLLPLAVLLELSLLFPEQAPSHFRVALTSGSTKHLHEHLAEAQRKGVAGDVSAAAEAILSLVAALGAHHRPSRKHSERVRAYTELLAEQLDLSPRDRHRLRWASLLHDVGKVTVSLDILEGTGDLSDESWSVIRRHPIEGARLIEPLRDWLGEWAPTVEQHHERFDGQGYPNGLAGHDICLGARIVAVADSFEAMTARRSYQEPMPIPAARKRLLHLAGSQFDPAVVRAFLAVSLGQLRWAYGPLAWAAEAPALVGFSRLAPSAMATGVRAGVAAVAITAAAGATGTLPATHVLAQSYTRAEGTVTGDGARAGIATPVGTPLTTTPTTTSELPGTTSTTTASSTTLPVPPVSVPTLTTPTTTPVITVTVPTLPPVTVPTVPPLLGP